MGVFQKYIYKRTCQVLAINAQEMAPRTTRWLQERQGDAPTKGLAWVGVHCTCGIISPLSERGCVKSLRSSHMGLHPQIDVWLVSVTVRAVSGRARLGQGHTPFMARQVCLSRQAGRLLRSLLRSNALQSSNPTRSVFQVVVRKVDSHTHP